MAKIVYNNCYGGLWRMDEYDGNESVMTKDGYEWHLAKD